MNEDEPDTHPGVGLVRVRLDLSYGGGDFAGWALQPGQRTVLGELSQALDVLVPSRGPVTVAGRTDAGCMRPGRSPTSTSPAHNGQASATYGPGWPVCSRTMSASVRFARYRPLSMPGSPHSGAAMSTGSVTRRGE